MNAEKPAAKIVPFIRSLYPKASDQELEEAQQVLTDYVAAVVRIFDRIDREREPDSLAHADHSRI
jgi:hypothetical protein